jgi:hypothetical protein
MELSESIKEVAIEKAFELAKIMINNSNATKDEEYQEIINKSFKYIKNGIDLL